MEAAGVEPAHVKALSNCTRTQCLAVFTGAHRYASLPNAKWKTGREVYPSHPAT